MSSLVMTDRGFFSCGKYYLGVAIQQSRGYFWPLRFWPISRTGHDLMRAFEDIHAILLVVPAMTIDFIITGNVYRSRLAEALLLCNTTLLDGLAQGLEVSRCDILQHQLLQAQLATRGH